MRTCLLLTCLIYILSSQAKASDDLEWPLLGIIGAELRMVNRIVRIREPQDILVAAQTAQLRRSFTRQKTAEILEFLYAKGYLPRPRSLLEESIETFEATPNLTLRLSDHGIYTRAELLQRLRSFNRELWPLNRPDTSECLMILQQEDLYRPRTAREWRELELTEDEYKALETMDITVSQPLAHCLRINEARTLNDVVKAYKNLALWPGMGPKTLRELKGILETLELTPPESCKRMF